MVPFLGESKSDASFGEIARVVPFLGRGQKWCLFMVGNKSGVFFGKGQEWCFFLGGSNFGTSSRINFTQKVCIFVENLEKHGKIKGIFFKNPTNSPIIHP